MILETRSGCFGFKTSKVFLLHILYFLMSKSFLRVLFIIHFFFFPHNDHVFLYILELVKYLYNSCFIPCIAKSLYSGLWEYILFPSKCGLWELLCTLYSNVSSLVGFGSFFSHMHRLVISQNPEGTLL